MARPRPTKADRQVLLGGDESVAAKAGKVISGNGTYSLPATPIANPDVTVTNASVRAGACVLVSLTGRGGISNPLMAVSPTPASISADGSFTFNIYTKTDIPSEAITYNYIVVNP